MVSVTGAVSVRMNRTVKVCSHRKTRIMLTFGTFDIFDGYCDGQNGFCSHFARQRNAVFRCEQALVVTSLAH